MTKVLIKIALLLTFLLLIKQLASWISPDYQQLDGLNAYKYEVLVEKDINLVFLGNSRLKKGIIPAVIDSINPEWRSYNLGEDHFSFPYTSDWVDQYLERLPALKVIVMELTGTGEKILDLDSWLPYASTSIDPSNGWRHELGMLTTVQENFLETYLSPLPNFVSFLQGGRPDRVFKNTQAGFVPYPSLKKRNKMPPSFARANQYTRQALEEIAADSVSSLPLIYRSTIDRLIAQCQQASVSLVFLAPSVFAKETEVDIYRPLVDYARQKAVPVLEITHPLLLEESHRYDTRHFNQKGAQLYSELLGKSLQELLK